MKIDYLTRQLLSKKIVRTIIEKMYGRYKKGENKFEIYLDGVSSCLNNAYSDQDLWQINEIAYKQAINNCYESDELKILESFKVNKVIELSHNGGEDGDEYIGEIQIINEEFFKEIVGWVLNYKFVINYDLFSLNTLTGEAYCHDNGHIFKPGTGYYDLFKQFLIRKNHFISFEEIYLIQQQEYKNPNSSINKNTYKINEKKNTLLKNKSNERIKYLKKKLEMKDGFGELFKTYEKRGFILLPDLIKNSPPITTRKT